MLFALAACGRTSADSIPADAPPLDEGAVRQPIPAGIDPAMVTWRGDGVLIPSTDSLQKTPGYVVDSIFPMPEMIRRFQQEAGPAVDRLAGGAPSMDSLLRTYWALLVHQDTLAMTPLVVSKAEFAHLYFPPSREATSGVPPAVSWLLLSNNGGRGLTRALRDAAGSAAAPLATTCQPLVLEAGDARITGPCAVIRRRGTTRDTVWFVQHVIEHRGIFKLMSFANEL
jgi:hypothetical protein